MDKKLEFEKVTEKENFGEVVRLLLISRDFTNQEIAKELNCSSAYISAIKIGKKKPAWRLLRDLLYECNFTLEQLSEVIDYYNAYGEEKERFENTLYQILKICMSNSKA